MTTLENRINEIQKRLDLAFLEAQDEEGNPICAIATPPKEVWAGMVVPPRYKYGYLPPVVHGEPPTLVSYCPQIIAEQTLEFDDDELDFYLDNVEFQIFMHMSFLLSDADTSLDERQAKVDDILHESNVEALMQFLAMQSDILDRV